MTGFLVGALLLLAAAYLGEIVGVRRERRRTAADFATLRAEIHTQHAALISIPNTEQAAEHRQAVAAEHRLRWQPSVDSLAAHFTRRAA
ncbi:hypothetical protein AB0J20_16480 [Micromonospora costi]|uniref:hypothetical protein n=1 Tax=Micromonospora costi TaxID=1530042 RepID=UPI0033C3E0D2